MMRLFHLLLTLLLCQNEAFHSYTIPKRNGLSPLLPRLKHTSQLPSNSYSQNFLKFYPSKSRLTTKERSDDEESKIGVFRRAKNKFVARPGTYLIIPVIAALVGWFTNYLAVQMIFYPVQYRGLPIWIKPEVPLGFIGWQGIVPCKTKTMSIAIVDMVTTQLLTVKEAFGRLDPKKTAELLSPRVGTLGTEIISDLFPQ